LFANKLRSALTVLGMTIGVASVIVLISIGTGSSHAVQQRIQALGTNVLLVQRGFRRGGSSAGVATAPLTLAAPPRRCRTRTRRRPCRPSRR
jgi:putative ABC transport system permease protein